MQIRANPPKPISDYNIEKLSNKFRIFDKDVSDSLLHFINQKYGRIFVDSDVIKLKHFTNNLQKKSIYIIQELFINLIDSFLENKKYDFTIFALINQLRNNPENLPSLYISIFEIPNKDDNNWKQAKLEPMYYGLLMMYYLLENLDPQIVTDDNLIEVLYGIIEWSNIIALTQKDTEKFRNIYINNLIILIQHFLSKYDIKVNYGCTKIDIYGCGRCWSMCKKTLTIRETTEDNQTCSQDIAYCGQQGNQQGGLNIHYKYKYLKYKYKYKKILKKN